MAKIYSWDGIVPVIDPSAFVHPEAVVIGDVIIGPGVYVGPCAVLRGDFGRIVLHQGSNVQETCVVHSFPGKDVVVEELGHIGHGAILHGCHIANCPRMRSLGSGRAPASISSLRSRRRRSSPRQWRCRRLSRTGAGPRRRGTIRWCCHAGILCEFGRRCACTLWDLVGCSARKQISYPLT
jgi:hypothetical protein